MSAFPNSSLRAQSETQFIMREIKAPAGWTAGVLEIEYPAELEVQRRYAAVVEELLLRLPMFERATAGEVLLQFDRCAPDREIPILQENARSWQPEIGLGVWLDREPPTLWSKEEFLAAAPGTLRPVMYRVFRIQSDPVEQAAAWQRLLGSGVLMRIVATRPNACVEGATEYLQPRIHEPSLTSFPFFVPLLTEAALKEPHWIYAGGPEAWLPEMDGYIRESAEDGGLLILARQPPESFWRLLDGEKTGIDSVRLQRSELGAPSPKSTS